MTQRLETPQKAPPVGLVPPSIWADEVADMRLKQIIQAMNRYIDADCEIPLEWKFELQEILERIN